MFKARVKLLESLPLDQFKIGLRFADLLPRVLELRVCILQPLFNAVKPTQREMGQKFEIVKTNTIDGRSLIGRI